MAVTPLSSSKVQCARQGTFSSKGMTTPGAATGLAPDVKVELASRLTASEALADAMAVTREAATGVGMGAGFGRLRPSIAIPTPATAIISTAPTSTGTSGSLRFPGDTEGSVRAKSAGSGVGGSAKISAGGEGMVISCIHCGHATRMPT
jgi:hypothetical protein